MATEFGQRLRAALDAGDPAGESSNWSQSKTSREDPLANHPEIYSNAWSRITQAVEDHNEHGQSAAFIGVEWTSNPERNNLHRNLIFRGGKSFHSSGANRLCFSLPGGQR